MLQADAIITLGAGQYRLREQLAGSAYGLVWRAAAPGDGPDVALKLINEAQMLRAHPDLRSRWTASVEREIVFLQSLEPWDARHIVRLLDSGIHDGLPVMALELMDRDLGRCTLPIPFATVLDWLGQVNQALAKVHQYGWRYLDLKPANVLLHPNDNSVRLADFGTSEPLAAQPATTFAGTASWQAPEQFFPTPRNTYDTDARTDYFALGAMFYYLVTGGQPLRFCSDCGQAYREHQAGGASALLAKHHGNIPPTLGGDEAALFARRSASAGALPLLRALLAADRSDRPQHALQISRMIAAARTSQRCAP